MLLGDSLLQEGEEKEPGAARSLSSSLPLTPVGFSDIVVTMSKRTIRCKMAPTAPMIEALDRTCETFAWACNAILARALAAGVSNNVKLHRLVYADIRADYGLSANLVVRAIRRVSAAMIAAKKRQRLPKEFRPTSIDYDA